MMSPALRKEVKLNKTIRENVEEIDKALASISSEVNDAERDIDQIRKTQLLQIKQLTDMQAQMIDVQTSLVLLQKAVDDLTLVESKIAAELVPPATTPGVPVKIVFTLGTVVPQ